MKRIALLSGAALVIVLSAVLVVLLPSPVDAQQPGAAAAPVCLNLRNIQRTEAVDDRTIDFHMRDGTVWRNTLRRVCPMLKVSPFTQVLRGADQVCANQQLIHVQMTGDTCPLGDFAPAPAAR